MYDAGIALAARHETRRGTPKTPETAIFKDFDGLIWEAAHENLTKNGGQGQAKDVVTPNMQARVHSTVIVRYLHGSYKIVTSSFGKFGAAG